MEKGDFSVVRNNIDVMENMANIEDIMNCQGFEFVKISDDNRNIAMFINKKTMVIAEANIISFSFKLVYANTLMRGFLDTGWLDKLSEELLHQVMLEFIEPVSILRSYYEQSSNRD